MSKSMLVIDTPEKCIRCPLLNGADECIAQDDDANFNAGDSWDELMKGCPLKPLPEKMKVTGIYNYVYLEAGGKPSRYRLGWNDCIDAITGGGDSDD